MHLPTGKSRLMDFLISACASSELVEEMDLQGLDSGETEGLGRFGAHSDSSGEREAAPVDGSDEEDMSPRQTKEPNLQVPLASPGSVERAAIRLHV